MKSLAERHRDFFKRDLARYYPDKKSIINRLKSRLYDDRLLYVILKLEEKRNETDH